MTVPPQSRKQAFPVIVQQGIQIRTPCHDDLVQLDYLEVVNEDLATIHPTGEVDDKILNMVIMINGVILRCTIHTNSDVRNRSACDINSDTV